MYMLYLFFYKRLKNNDSYLGMWGMLTPCYALHVHIGFSPGDTGLDRRNSLKVSKNTRWKARGGRFTWVEGEEEGRDRDQRSQV